MRKLIQGTVLLAVIVLVACEEAATPKPAPAERPAQLYTEIGADELLERWAVMPGGAVAEAAANPSRRRRAAASDGFSGLPHTFRFIDAREYGACVVFTIESEGEIDGRIYRDKMGVIDCVGSRHEKNPVEGLFHAANLCLQSGSFLHILRAGNFNPSTHAHEIRDWHDSWVNARIADHEDSFQWLKYITPDERSDPILVNWALLGTGEHYEDEGGTAGFDSLHRRDELHFQVDHSKGVVKVEPNDGAAFTEYRRRCESLGSESAIRPTPS